MLSDRLRLAFFLMLGAAACALARPAADISVEAISQDEGVQVTARAVVHAPAELIWQTLTDYDHLPQFVPGIDSSRVLSRQALLQDVWGYDFLGDSNVIDVTISHLRRALEADGEPRLIHTVRPIGYILNARLMST